MNEYIYNQLQQPFVATRNDIITKIKNNERVIFTKFGDGEHACMTYHSGTNCDKDTYTSELGTLLRKAFCILSSIEGAYIGKWHGNDTIAFYASIYYDYLITNNKELNYIPFIDYHFITNDIYFNTNDSLYNLVQTIQYSNKNKIIISNSRNQRLMNIFKGNHYMTIPDNSWYANGKYNELYNRIISLLSSDKNDIILIAGGLASKVLIQEIASNFTMVSCIDLGSGFDILARNVDTRGWFNYHSYEDECLYYKNLLPEDWINYKEDKM